MSLLKKTFIAFTGNRRGQRMLDSLAERMQLLRGIGSGSSVGESGEEAAVRLLMRSHTPPHMIFDVGANQGQYALMAISALGSQPYRLHCFEPSKKTYTMLGNALAGNADDRVTTVNTALGKEPGTLPLYTNDAGSGLASLTQRRLDFRGITFTQAETVQVDTIDRYCTEHGIAHIDLLKCDVEGHELDVFAGASAMFQKGAIRCVMFEFGGCNIDTRTYFQDFWNFFKDAGMKIFRITPSGYLHPIPEYHETLEQFMTTNYLAVHTEIAALIQR